MATQHVDLAGSVDVSPSSGVVAARSGPTDYLVAASHGDVADYAREGQDLVIAFGNGETVRLTGFFASGFDNHLVFSDGTVADFTQALTSGGDGVAEALVRYGAHGADMAGKMGLLPILAGIAAGGAGIAAAVSGGGNDNRSGSAAPAPTRPAPAGNLAVNDGDNDGRIELSGTAAPGTKVTVKWPDGSSQTVNVGGDGKWTVEAASPQDADGKATVTVIDGNGNQSDPVIRDGLADTVPPALASGITVNDGDNDGRPELTGKAEPGATVTVIWPTGETGSVTADANGDWTLEAPAVQNPADEATVIVTDAAGNGSGSVTVGLSDEVAPDAPSDVAVSDTDGDGLPDASGTAEPGALITVHWPDGSTAITTADADGKWTVEAPVSQPNGDVTATATD
ncbi:MAG: Ig-like domain-containing protein, partial [Novosphingobium sp.]|nr:Ig-like domain-containing protein [Novosphingobium sp.]